jgi:hypothetical protein
MPCARILALLAILLGGSCSGAALIRAPERPLERAIFLREAAEDGWQGISDAAPFATDVTRVIDPSGVDPDSRLEIAPAAAQLAEAARAAGVEPTDARLRLEAWIERRGADPIALHLPGYDALDAYAVRATPRAIADAPPTELDLTRTIAREGDRVLLRATIEDGVGAPAGEAFDARFRVAQLGWYSAYHPSVVLARPGTPRDGDADFRFTPGIAWLHSYAPRPDEQGAWAAWMRGSGMSAGPHAMLLQFDTEDEVEVGLGVPVGFWNGVLQLGVGYNLMADGGQDRLYTYIGSSLISLAQAADRSFGALQGF